MIQQPPTLDPVISAQIIAVWGLLVVALLTSITSVILGIVNRTNQKNLEKWRSETEKQLSIVREDIKRNGEILNVTVSNYAQNYHAAQERRLQAVEALWDGMRELRELANPAVVFQSTFSALEKDIERDPAFFSDLVSKIDASDISHKALAVRKNVAKHRPFLGENIWAFFVAYQVLVSTVVDVIVDEWEKKNFRPLSEYENIRQLVKILLREKERLLFEKAKWGEFMYLVSAIEDQFMRESEGLVNGQLVAEKTFSQAVDTLDKIRTIENRASRKRKGFLVE